MLKKLKASLIAIAALTAAGCANFGTSEFGYYATNQPTPETISASKYGVQIYKNTAFLLSDFKENGELKTFLDYDFTVESAPCTVLDVYEKPPVHREEYFSVRMNDGIEHTFVCKRRNSAPEYRLFLVSSKLECSTRTWAMEHSAFKSFRDMAKQCDDLYDTYGTEEIESQYKKSVGRS